MKIDDIDFVHCKLIAQMHEESFAESWTEKAFADLIGLPATFGFVAISAHESEPLGFVLCQGDRVEAEIITIATRPQVRRGGVAHHLLDGVCACTRRVFLEVARDNPVAISFYEKYGFNQIGLRKNYYKRTGTASVDALVYEFTVCADVLE
jgi:ribosomal-protein-alanine N-acetyltransferase